MGAKVTEQSKGYGRKSISQFWFSRRDRQGIRTGRYSSTEVDAEATVEEHFSKGSSADTTTKAVSAVYCSAKGKLDKVKDSGCKTFGCVESCSQG